MVNSRVSRSIFLGCRIFSVLCCVIVCACVSAPDKTLSKLIILTPVICSLVLVKPNTHLSYQTNKQKISVKRNAWRWPTDRYGRRDGAVCSQRSQPSRWHLGTFLFIYLFLLLLFCFVLFLLNINTDQELSTCNRHTLDGACNICQPTLNKTNKRTNKKKTVEFSMAIVWRQLCHLSLR